MATEAQRRASKKYIEASLEQIAIRVPKGKRDEYKTFAEENGESLARMITRLIEEEMERKA